MDITVIGIKKALLWHTNEIRTRRHVETPGGQGGRAPLGFQL